MSDAVAEPQHSRPHEQRGFLADRTRWLACRICGESGWNTAAGRRSHIRRRHPERGLSPLPTGRSWIIMVVAMALAFAIVVAAGYVVPMVTGTLSGQGSPEFCSPGVVEPKASPAHQAPTLGGLAANYNLPGVRGDLWDTGERRRGELRGNAGDYDPTSSDSPSAPTKPDKLSPFTPVVNLIGPTLTESTVDEKLERVLALIQDRSKPGKPALKRLARRLLDSSPLALDTQSAIWNDVRIETLVVKVLKRLRYQSTSHRDEWDPSLLRQVDALLPSPPDRILPRKDRPMDPSTVAVPPTSATLVVRMGDHGQVELRSDGIYWVKLKHSDKTKTYVEDSSWPVLLGELVPLSRRHIEGATLFEFKFDGETSVASATDVVSRLKAAGAIVSVRDAQDALSAILRVGTQGRVLRGHAAAGVYVGEDRRLVLDLEPYPLRTEQKTAVDEIRTATDGVTATGADIQAYGEFIGFVNAFEGLPAMGLAAISWFAYVLRSRGVLVPFLYHDAKLSGLGKSSVLVAFSEKLFGLMSASAESVQSRFTWAAYMDSVCGARTIEEGELLSEKLLGASIKDGAERANGAARGKRDQDVAHYAHRGVLFISGQSRGFTGEPTLVRIISVHFDTAKKGERARHHDHFDRVYSSLRPIGIELVRHAITMYPTLDELLAEIHAKRLEIDRGFAKFKDARRGQAWAVVYVGLGIWESFAKSLGANWTRPTLQQFVADVVAPIEAATTADTTNAALSFARWFEKWRATNGYTGRSSVLRGEGALFERDSVEVGAVNDPLDLDYEPGVDVPGWWVAPPLIEEYNATAAPADRLTGLADLARACADSFHMPRDIVARNDSDAPGEYRGHSVRFGTGNGPKIKRAAFIPDDFEQLASGEATLPAAAAAVAPPAAGDGVGKPEAREQFGNADLPSVNAPPFPRSHDFDQAPPGAVDRATELVARTCARDTERERGRERGNTIESSIDNIAFPIRSQLVPKPFPNCPPGGDPGASGAAEGNAPGSLTSGASGNGAQLGPATSSERRFDERPRRASRATSRPGRSRAPPDGMPKAQQDRGE